MASSYDKTLRDHFGIQTTKHISRKSSLLKDYLMDDLSSCSSSGFNSFPRQQYCCTTVGQRKKTINTTLPPKSHSKRSALYRASEAVMNTFKSIPLSQKNGAKAKKAATSFISRSFSRKVLLSSRRFWKKGTKEKGIINDGSSSSSSTRRWMRYFRELLVMEEGDKTTSNEDITFIVNVSATTNFWGSESNKKSWGESEFTFSSSSESSAEKENADKVDGGVTTRDWPNEEKEQLSPVSILDCPFEDDEEITSHFNSTIQGNQNKQNQKKRHFKGVASLEPITLEEQMIQSELELETYKSRSSLFPSFVTLEKRMVRSDLEVETYESRSSLFLSSITLEERMAQTNLEFETYESLSSQFPSSVTLEERMAQSDLEFETNESRSSLFSSSVTVEERMARSALEVETYELSSSIFPSSITLEERMVRSDLKVETYESKSSLTLSSATLEERMTQSELDVETYEPRSYLFPSSPLVPPMCTQNVTTNTLSDNLNENVLDLLNFIKTPIPSNYFITKVENLLIDYFKQTIEENNNNIDHSKKLHLCEVAEDWIIGQPQELYLGWEMKEGRHVYIREMDKEWKNSDEESQQVTHELENEVLTSLVNELILDLMMQQVSSSIVFSIL